eukprot:scaffold205916_cov15-Tisochrysis_lutea.AAC.1
MGRERKEAKPFPRGNFSYYSTLPLILRTTLHTPCFPLASIVSQMRWVKIESYGQAACGALTTPAPALLADPRNAARAGAKPTGLAGPGRRGERRAGGQCA